jgi:hypothetical protein
MNAGYSGFVVSEAKTTLQMYDEFKKLKAFYDYCVQSSINR